MTAMLLSAVQHAGDSRPGGSRNSQPARRTVMRSLCRPAQCSPHCSAAIAHAWQGERQEFPRQKPDRPATAVAGRPAGRPAHGHRMSGPGHARDCVKQSTAADGGRALVTKFARPADGVAVAPAAAHRRVAHRRRPHGFKKAVRFACVRVRARVRACVRAHRRVAHRLRADVRGAGGQALPVPLGLPGAADAGHTVLKRPYGLRACACG